MNGEGRAGDAEATQLMKRARRARYDITLESEHSNVTRAHPGNVATVKQAVAGAGAGRLQPGNDPPQGCLA